MTKDQKNAEVIIAMQAKIDSFEVVYDYKLTVLGNPKAQGRARARNAGSFVQIYDDPKSAQAKRKLETVVQEQAPEQLLDCPLRVDLYHSQSSHRFICHQSFSSLCFRW